MFVTEATEQLSFVIGEPSATPLAVQTPRSAGTVKATGQVIVGNCVSITVAVCIQVAEFPDPSTTVQVTIVFPNGKIAGALFVVEATEQLSAVVGVPRTTAIAVHVPKSAGTVTFEGQAIVGSCVSVTVTV